MDPTIDAVISNAGNVPAFYDSLAPDYDEMTGFAGRFVREKPFFRFLVETYGIDSALDAGCGTGFHSLLLAQLGVRVTAVDVAEEMLIRLHQHARAMSLDIATVRADIGSIAGGVEGPFDAVFSMGNTLAHFPGEKELGLALRSASTLLRPGGLFFAQVVNFERILVSRQRVQSVRESGSRTFVRFYDFDGAPERIGFNILRLERTGPALAGGGGEITPSLISVQLLALTAHRLTAMLNESGFTGVRLFGSIAMDTFVPATSPDLVVLASRP
jgi:SAM-dependent methyltransferase